MGSGHNNFTIFCFFFVLVFVASIKKSVHKNFAKFTGNQPFQSLLFNKVADMRPASLLEKILWDRSFPVDFAKFLRTPFFTEHLRTTVSLLSKKI